MIFSTFIAQIRNNAKIFEGRVAGAAEFNAGLKNYNTALPLPAAYVLPLALEVGPNQAQNGIYQICSQNVGVVVELDAQRDRRGQSAAMQLDLIRVQLNASVIGATIPGICQYRSVYGVGGEPLDLDRARLFYRFDYGVDYLMDDADGIQTEGIDLISIELDIFKAPVSPGDLPAAITVLATSGQPFPPPTDGPWPEPEPQEATK